MREYIMDFIEMFTAEELAQCVREGLITLADIELALRRRLKL